MQPLKMKPSYNIYRAAAHVHTDWSYDGRWPMGKLRGMFARMGIQIILTTEHSQGFNETKWNQYRKVCLQTSTEKFHIIPGLEYSDHKNLFHIMVWGNLPFLGENHNIRELLKNVKSLGGIAVLAHPSRGEAWKEYDTNWSKYLNGIELWNRKADGFRPSLDAYRLLNLQTESLIPFVGWDFHRIKQLYPLTMKLHIAGDVNEDSVAEALRQGRCESLAWGIPAEKFVTGGYAGIARFSEKMRKTATNFWKNLKTNPFAIKLRR